MPRQRRIECEGNGLRREDCQGATCLDEINRRDFLIERPKQSSNPCEVRGVNVARRNGTGAKRLDMLQTQIAHRVNRELANLRFDNIKGRSGKEGFLPVERCCPTRQKQRTERKPYDSEMHSWNRSAQQQFVLRDRGFGGQARL
jgi:hypothetical protein